MFNRLKNWNFNRKQKLKILIDKQSLVFIDKNEHEFHYTPDIYDYHNECYKIDLNQFIGGTVNIIYVQNLL